MAIDVRKFDEETVYKLMKADLLTASKILSLSRDELRNATNICSTNTIEKIMLTASETVLQLYKFIDDTMMLTTGCSKMDVILGGGICCSPGINELSGQSGCGKTQLCLQLSLTAQFPKCSQGLEKCVLYICTEENFPSRRLQQLIKHFITREKIPYGNQIFVEQLSDLPKLRCCLFEKLPKLIESHKIGLLIIDSIAALFRSDYSLGDGVQRTKDLRMIGIQLHYLSRECGLCILCVNQVSAHLIENLDVPALGLAWANLVTTRIVMQRDESFNRRKLRLVFSPHSGVNECFIEIKESGIQACD